MFNLYIYRSSLPPGRDLLRPASPRLGRRDPSRAHCARVELSAETHLELGGLRPISILAASGIGCSGTGPLHRCCLLLRTLVPASEDDEARLSLCGDHKSMRCRVLREKSQKPSASSWSHNSYDKYNNHKNVNNTKNH